MSEETTPDDIVIAVITCADAGEAERIATALIEEHLGACAQWHAHESLYRWQGRIERATETRLLVKSRKGLLKALIDRVRALHSYELPAILALEPGAVLPEFADWVRAETAAGR